VRRPFRWWTVVFPAVVLAFVIATRMRAASDWLEQLSVIKTPLDVLLQAAGTSGLPPPAVESMKSWFLLGLVGIAACPLLSVMLAAMNLIGRGATAVSSGGDTGEDWQAGLFSAMGVGLDGMMTAGGDDAVGHAAGNDPCNDFFAERSATAAQAAAFHQVVSLAEECHAAAPGRPNKPCPSADFILEGPTGSGRTATLIAVLLQSALVTGDTAIVLVGSGAKRDNLVSRLLMATRSLRVDGFIGVGPLTPDAVSQWAGAPDTPVDQGATTIAPRILVGTLEGLEAAFFSTPYAFNALRRVLLQVDTVAIDDLDGFRTDDHLHLPHTLAKLRLIRASEGQPLRTILITRPIADAARQLVARQLMKSASHEGHWFLLTTVPPPPGSTLSVPTQTAVDGVAGMADQLVTMARDCRKQGLNVLVLAPNATRVGLAEILGRCRVAGGQKERLLLEAVSDLDAIPTLGSQDHGMVAAAACAAFQVDGDTACVVTWKAGDSTAAVFRLTTEASKGGDAVARHSLMVLPGKECGSLFAQHFASAARFLPRLLPIPRAVLTAMGLPAVGSLQSGATRYRQRPADMVTVADRMILLDPPDCTADGIAADPVRWPSGSLAQFGDDAPPAPRRVAVRGDVTASMGILTDSSGGTVTVLERPSASLPQRTGGDVRSVSWKATDGSELDVDDLAYMHSFCLRTEQGAFVPNR
jgi:hypothetical protein